MSKMVEDRKNYFISELENIHEVPTLPQVALKLIEMISDETSSMRQIGDLIEEDPPMVAKILKIVNSGLYNLPREIQNIRQAVVMIGLDELRNLVFAMSVFSVFYHIEEDDYFSFLGFWKHSAATGKVASVLSTYLNLNINQAAFLGGLLHDFGRLILQLYFREEYQNVFHYADENMVTLYRAESEAIRFTHTEAGYWLAKHWNLPEDITGVIRNHHTIQPDGVESDPLLALIHVADRITNIWGVGIEPVPVMDSLEEDEIWKKMTEVYPRLKEFPLDKMTRVFDMHLEEAEKFVEEISSFQKLSEDVD